MSDVLRFDMQAEVGAAMRAIGSLPPALTGALHTRAYDLLSNHRAKTIKDNKFDRRSGRKLVAGGYRRYVRSDAESPASLRGLGLMDRKSGREPSEVSDFWSNTEAGGRIEARDWMLVPIGRRPPNWRERVKQRKFVLIRRPGKVPILIMPIRGQGRLGDRSRLVAVLTRIRTQRPLLGFAAAWRSVVPKHRQKLQAMLERTVELAAREGGEEKVAAHLARNTSALVGRESAFLRALEKERIAADAKAREAKHNEPGTAGGGL